MSKKSNALPSGGGGGGWSKLNEEMTENRRKKQAEGQSRIPGGLAYGEMHIADGADRKITGTSLFDPVLCELAYRWFCPEGGLVLDPFAGGSVRGITASLLSRRYIGFDLSEAQIEANEDQISLANAECEPQWFAGDSANELPALMNAAGVAPGSADFILTCPPYADLEVYSDDPRDISTMPYPLFREGLARAVHASCERLANDRFAAIVIGDVRDKDGLLYGLPAHCIQMFEDAGLRLYNDAILATAIASLPIRCRKQFSASRKLGRCHQYFLVFVKGDPVVATKAVGEPQFGEPGDVEGMFIEPAEPDDPPENPKQPDAPTAEGLPAKLKVSAKWLSNRHDCTLSGIKQRCGGQCCHTKGFWPPKSGNNGDGPCPKLGENGCTFEPADRPVTCLLYPLRVNKAGTLILHQRAVYKKGICGGNFGEGPMLIDAMQGNLTELFGEEQFKRVRASVAAGADDYFEVPPEIQAAYARELPLEAQNLPPEPRRVELTPVETHGGVLCKRDDLFERAGVKGGKVRTCWTLCQGANGLVTAGSRKSPQVNIVAHIARELGVPCRAHVPSGELGPELEAAKAAGAEVVQHAPGYNNVIVKRARDDAAELGWREIPFGMECQEAVEATASQVTNLPWDQFRRIVVPIGSGMSFAGILAGLEASGRQCPVLGVQVGADPFKRLAKFAPDWRRLAEIVEAPEDYHQEVEGKLGDLDLDPIYEAKCLQFLQAGDLLWIVGIREQL